MAAFAKLVLPSFADAVQGNFNVVREPVQKVIIAPSPDGSADLTTHGRLATILASMKEFQDYSASMRAGHHQKEKIDFAVFTAKDLEDRNTKAPLG
ncbi:hypothetical protein, partial [Shinella sp. BYT-45]|uniref:hypothetical protein n=1 Tax=Shinella sp. BYT-45 TaxID=3377377 RepID=UPI003980C265